MKIPKLPKSPQGALKRVARARVGGLKVGQAFAARPSKPEG